MNHSPSWWGDEEVGLAITPIHFRSEEKGVSARRVCVGRMSSRWKVWRMSIRATSVAWPTSLLNSPMWALLQRFPEIKLALKEGGNLFGGRVLRHFRWGER